MRQVTSRLLEKIEQFIPYLTEAADTDAALNFSGLGYLAINQIFIRKWG